MTTHNAGSSASNPGQMVTLHECEHFSASVFDESTRPQDEVQIVLLNRDDIAETFACVAAWLAQHAPDSVMTMGDDFISTVILDFDSWEGASRPDVQDIPGRPAVHYANPDTMELYEDPRGMSVGANSEDENASDQTLSACTGPMTPDMLGELATALRVIAPEGLRLTSLREGQDSDGPLFFMQLAVRQLQAA